MANRSLSRYNGGLSSPMDDFFNQQLERFFGMNPSGGALRSRQDQRNGGSSLPAVNVRETDSAFEIEVAAPGLQKDAFNVHVEDGVLCISAKSESETETEDQGSGYHRREFSYSSFERRFQLPDTVEDEQIAASYDDGILKLTLPKVPAEEQQPKKRTIEIG